MAAKLPQLPQYYNRLIPNHIDSKASVLAKLILKLFAYFGYSQVQNPDMDLP